MSRSTFFMVQFFTWRERQLTADPPIVFTTEDQAIWRADRDRKTRAGVLVTAITGDPDAGAWEKPEILLAAGCTTLMVSFVDFPVVITSWRASRLNVTARASSLGPAPTNRR